MTTLYRMFGENDRLLYVGISCNPGQRFKQHAGGKGWWQEVRTVTTEHFPTREDAAAAELAAIRAERPRWNVVGNGKAKTPEPTSVEGSPSGLIDRYFLGDRDRKWQGVVVAEAVPGVFLVELFSWLNGTPTHQTLIGIEEMSKWRFYDDAEWMVNDYERIVKEQWEVRSIA